MAGSLRVVDLKGNGALLAASPALARVRSLALVSCDAIPDLVAICRSPHLARLRELRLGLVHSALDPAWLEAMEREHLLPGLRVLHLEHTFVAAETAPALLAMAERRGLEMLDLRDARATDATRAFLFAGLGPRFVPAPPPPRDVRPEAIRARVRGGKLDLQGISLTAAELAAIVACGPLAGVRELKVDAGDDLLAILAKSGAFPALRTLYLDAGPLTYAAARAFADAVGLARLSSIVLGRVDADGDVGTLGKGDGAVVELARSQGLPGLRRIACWKEWRAYTKGEREETVSMEIPRDGGASVECVILHTIWP